MAGTVVWLSPAGARDPRGRAPEERPDARAALRPVYVSAPRGVGHLQVEIDALRASLDGCAALDPASREEFGMILEQAQLVVDERDLSLAGDVQTLLEHYARTVREACALGG